MAVRFHSMAARFALIAGSTLATAALIEALLRVFPALWPQGAYGVARLSPDLGLEVHAAGSVYRGERWVTRHPNRDGFLDVDHRRRKPPGVTRVGFFGDSYVEALQVPLEDTFFRRLPAEIAGEPIESLAFGISGWGTLHSLVAYRVFGARYELDRVVVVFVKNDPGDDYRAAMRSGAPGAEITDRWARAATGMADSTSMAMGAWHSLDRELMLSRIVRVQASILCKRLQQRSGAGAPDPNALPSAWSPDTLAQMQRLTRRILARFRDEVAHDGREFSVLYVPRGNDELDGRLAPRDRWLPWLAQTCGELGIELLDPTDVLRAARAAGTVVYDDHWSPAGHQIVASFIAGHLAPLIQGARR